MTTDLTLSRFLAYAEDASNWAFQPWVNNCNVEGTGTPENSGFITNMKKRGWITTYEYEPGEAVINFTDDGVAIAAEHGINLDPT